MLALSLNILLLIGGIAVLIAGGEALVRGAVVLAKQFGVAPLIVGLTVVAFGTSAPELALNVAAAIRDNSGLSFGNIIGSNIANIGLIIGLAALAHPLRVHADVVSRELPIMVGATLFASALGLLGWRASDGGGEWTGGFSRIDGVLLLSGFVLGLAYTLRTSLRGRIERDAIEVALPEGVDERALSKPGWYSIGLVLLGLGLLMIGGAMSERGASAIARGLGVSDEVIGLTIVAIATSLPELVTSLVAARRGHVDLAVGNVVGSNVFNLLLVMGVTALVSPVTLPSVPPHAPFVAIGMMCLLSVALVPMSRTRGRVVSRVEGVILLLVYVSYMAYEVIVAMQMRSAPLAGGM